MKSIHAISLTILVFSAVAPCRGAPPPNQLSDAQRRGGWKLLFDGKTTKGWRNYQRDAISDGWVVKDGALVRQQGRAGDIVSENQYEDFELSIEYRISKGGNSGIMFHVTEDAPKPWHSGPEVQIIDNAAGRDGQKAGWLYQLYKPVKPDWARQFEKQVGFKSPEVDDATRPAGQWNRVYLRVSKQQCEVAVNGVSYYYFRKGDADWNKRVAASKFRKFAGFGKAAKGRLCLQDHGNEVAFRNIKLRELPPDGSVPDPVDGKLPLKGAVAFPRLKWEGWQGIDLEKGKTSKLRPMALTHAGDGSNRIFVATQSGMVHVFPNDPQAKQTKLFLDLRKKVHDWQKDNEEGLLGLAFHPNYKTNGQFFVYYSSADEPRTSIVSRFRVSKDSDRADSKSEEVVMKIPQPFSNHNGGSIAFGKDGYLYIALGDGGGRNDPMRHGQNLKTWMGSILRIDVDRKDAGKNYAIPADNPFKDRSGARPEIFAYGFRNIWRISVDRKTGTIWAGDVGQDLWEEINIVRRGGNYGWSGREGTVAFGDVPVKSQDRPIDPIWEYDHRVGKSITGGYVYRGSRRPELEGKYLYADFVTGKIWALEYDEKSGKAKKNYSIASTGIIVLAFGEDEAGEVYYLIETVDGRGIYRFERTKK